ncbi:MAG TPA: glycerol kinase [Acidimicrobiales bacterium]|nr:glycerol kinase [Acidimicrobiales bacterium]
MGFVVAIDAGTTGVRALAVAEDGHIVLVSYRELTQHFPQPGWVEHDAAEIWLLVQETLAELQAGLAAAHPGQSIAAIGITNQRETAVAWDTNTGAPLHRAIVWQDRRTARRCEELEAAGHLPLVRQRTGLVLDSYFSGTKWEWMLSHGGVAVNDRLALGTVDDWVCWKLTGGPAGGVHATDVSNAARTMCFDIVAGRWSDELCWLLGVPPRALGEVRASSGRFGTVSASACGGALAGVPVSGIAGDQQAALFGQCCFEPGDTKVTYGTGSFVLMNLGPDCPPPSEGLLTTAAWQVGDDFTYALEGAVFASGSTIQWLRDGLGLITEASETGALAASIPTTDGVFIVPAFTGLGSPWWDPDARGTIVGLTRGSGRAHLARAAVEAMSFQTRDVLDVMAAAAGRPVSLLRADGGAAVMDLLLQLQADQAQATVVRPATTEVTALGAAMLAGLAEGVWSTLSELRSLSPPAAAFEPVAGRPKADADHARWLAAVDRSRRWASAGVRQSPG